MWLPIAIPCSGWMKLMLKPAKLGQYTRSTLHHSLYVLWALPVSIWSIFLLPLAIVQGRWQVRAGVLEVSSPGLCFFLRGPCFRILAGDSGFAAATIGHVVIARDASAMASCRAHEHTHVRQCERWGVLFPLVYVVAGFWAAISARHWASFYCENPFELEAERVSSEVARSTCKQV